MFSSASGEGTGVGATDAAASDGGADAGVDTPTDAAADAEGLPPALEQAAMIGASAAAPPTSAIRSSRTRRLIRFSTM